MAPNAQVAPASPSVRWAALALTDTGMGVSDEVGVWTTFHCPFLRFERQPQGAGRHQWRRGGDSLGENVCGRAARFGESGKNFGEIGERPTENRTILSASETSRLVAGPLKTCWPLVAF